MFPPNVGLGNLSQHFSFTVDKLRLLYLKGALIHTYQTNTMICCVGLVLH
ncbi:hypothetical protein VCHA37P191_160036 [Vibrio chagasii]|nr:hypothetical protein VCHA37P191_160036 [Vibrio chagasii]CAH7344623.1 hypothetical protein VCHA51O444_30120 [Vibrio chagasii]CAH7416879.1 hypothetical protein VCHA57P511_20116 [Vibrio chagasii]